MTGPEQLFQQFADAYRRDGSADPREYLARTSGIDRAELRSLIEAFLERAPRREWDPVAFSGSMAERALAEVSAEDESPVTEGAGWVEVLPALRTKARLKRRTVVEQLAAALGFADHAERVAVYYNQMEHGQLAPSGVSTKVLEALAAIVGSSAESLRRAGAAGELEAGGGGEVFARAGAPTEGLQSPALRELWYADADRAEQPDELDLLFTGGE